MLRSRRLLSSPRQMRRGFYFFLGIILIKTALGRKSPLARLVTHNVYSLRIGVG